MEECWEFSIAFQHKVIYSGGSIKFKMVHSSVTCMRNGKWEWGVAIDGMDEMENDTIWESRIQKIR